MIKLPQRHSLVGETASVLRSGIQDGTWRGILPGERTLARRLHVSRPTVRAAVEQLEREGRLEVVPGIGRKILDQPERRPETAASTRDCVGVLSALPLHLMPPATLFYLNELRTALQHAGLQLEVFGEPGLDHGRRDAILENVARGATNIACWVLSAPSHGVQKWFARAGLPALIAGSAEPGIALPSIDLDYRAICRHASGLFLQQGHRRLVLFMAESAGLASALSEEGFRQGIAASSQSGIEGKIVLHDGSPAGIYRRLDAMLTLKHPPTALLVSRPQHVLATMSHLARRKIEVPGRMSLISRDSDSYLAFMTPRIAQYGFRRRLFAERLSRLVIQLATEGILQPTPHVYMPEFEPGETVAPPP
jgi:DNA-binding LacI/PurR family transcriptional regulator